MPSDRSSLTRAQALGLSIEVWTYLRDHPKIARKYRLPKRLWHQIRGLAYQCPLCDWFYLENRCVGCPLEGHCIRGRRIYYRWLEAETEKSRRYWANEMLQPMRYARCSQYGHPVEEMKDGKG